MQVCRDTHRLTLTQHTHPLRHIHMDTETHPYTKALRHTADPQSHTQLSITHPRSHSPPPDTCKYTLSLIHTASPMGLSAVRALNILKLPAQTDTYLAKAPGASITTRLGVGRPSPSTSSGSSGFLLNHRIYLEVAAPYTGLQPLRGAGKAPQSSGRWTARPTPLTRELPAE